MFTKEDSRSNTLILHNFNSDLSIDSICEITVNIAYGLHSSHGQKPTQPNVTPLNILYVYLSSSFRHKKEIFRI